MFLIPWYYCLVPQIEKLANDIRKFFVITHLKKLTELIAEAYFILNLTEVCCKESFGKKEDKWALFSLCLLLGWNMYGN